MEKKAKPQEIEDADYALRNIRYVCGGRVSSFGRSLAVLEEVASYEMLLPVIDDEVEKETFDTDEARSEINSEQSDEGEDSDEPIKKKKKILIIESDSDQSEEESLVEILSNPEQNMTSSVETHEGLQSEFDAGDIEGVSADYSMKDDAPSTSRSKSPCFFCGKFETGHDCKFCHLSCCNFCNTMEVDEITDIVCPNCFVDESNLDESEMDDRETVVLKNKRGRPRKTVPAGSILIPLLKKK